MKLKTFIIIDWANNHLFQDKIFSSFDDAWSFLYEQFPELENFEDYEVIEEQYYKPN
jgi:hypothetical protein